MNPRIPIREAVSRAQACGIRCWKTKRDGHWMFDIGNGRVVSVCDGRKEEVPARLAVAIRRAETCRV